MGVSTYTQDIAAEICELIAAGESVRTIATLDGMPSARTVTNWLEKHPEFAAAYARARDRQADVMDERILGVAAKCEAGEIDPRAASVAIGAYQWRAERLAAKRYGTKVDHQVSGDVHVTIKRFTDG